MFDIKEALKSIPQESGVYLMKDENDQIIYIGKAKNLKKRIKQYFQSKNHAFKIVKMIEGIRSFDYIMTDSEIEALILESNLIKKHRPKYNTRLTDDKSYPYIKITTKDPFPRVTKTREIKKDGSRYFGPYTSAYAVKQSIDSIRDIFKIRDCNLKIITGKEQSRPCLNYYINRCHGPCIGKIKNDQYKKIIDQVIDLLNGKEEELLRVLSKRMQEASDSQQFEQAATYRDRIQAIKNLSEKQKISKTGIHDTDVIGIASSDSDAVAQIFFIRGGNLMGKEDFLLDVNLEDSEEGILASFIKQFYAGTVYVPKEIHVAVPFQDMDVVIGWLSSKRGNKVEIRVPLKGEKNMLLKMVKKNAEEKLSKDVKRIKKKQSENLEAVAELGQLIGLKNPPNRIEAYDISNLQGVENVGSMVVFEKGMPNKSNYRRFRIKSFRGQDDYKSMEEMLDRRIHRGMTMIGKSKGQEGFVKMPDLILVDGGKGQVGVVLEVLNNYGLKIPVCGMIKDDKHMTKGLIFNKQEVLLLKNTELYRLISTIQNEAHRFAINYHRDLRKKSVFKTVLDDIEGVGEKRKLALLRKFGSVQSISEASMEELMDTPTLNQQVAKAVFTYFKQKNKGEK